jgi:GcrA cell cycle regulator
MMQSTWEEAHSVALRDCLEKGMSFAEIARALNERFGTAYSRNAAIGRARRLGLSVPMRERAARPLNKPKQVDARRIRELRARKVAKAAPKLTTVERAATLQLQCVAITPRHVALVNLDPGDCRYPYGGDAEGEPITFCGHPRHEGSSYCLSHFHLTSAPELLEKRAPARAPLRLVEAA